MKHEDPFPPARRRRLPIKIGACLFTLFLITGTAVFLRLPRIPQDPAYHRFADARAFLGIPNALNVLTNVPFVVVGLLGLWRVSRWTAPPAPRRLASIFFSGVALIGMGSAYYHGAPSDPTLVWDRLPMAFTFAALAGLMAGDRWGPRGAWSLLVLLSSLGTASVLFWHAGEQRGAGDLRPYAAFMALLVVGLSFLALMFPDGRLSGGRLLAAAGAYLLAKACEFGDAALFDATGFVSGHSLKHLLAALAAAAFLPPRPGQPRGGSVVEDANPLREAR